MEPFRQKGSSMAREAPLFLRVCGKRDLTVDFEATRDPQTYT